MNKNIMAIEEKINLASQQTDHLQGELQKELNKIFDKDEELQKVMREVESSNEYTLNDDGLYSWIRYTLPEKYLAYSAYLSTYLNEHGVCLDMVNDALQVYHGDDYISIQDDCGKHDNGIWQGHKMLFNESDYTDENGEVDEEKRNKLIENHMEVTGHFPGVFRVTKYGTVWPCSTQSKESKS